MRGSRIGEQLWTEWTGDGLDSPAEVIFFTEEDVDLEHDVVKRALASALQRDGVAGTLGEGYRLVEGAVVIRGRAGYVDESIDLTVCDENGETREGDEVAKIIEVTWVCI